MPHLREACENHGCLGRRVLSFESARTENTKMQNSGSRFGKHGPLLLFYDGACFCRRIRSALTFVQAGGKERCAIRSACLSLLPTTALAAAGDVFAVGC